MSYDSHHRSLLLNRTIKMFTIKSIVAILKSFITPVICFLRKSSIDMSGVKILEVCMHNDYNEWSVIRQKRMSNLKTIVE